MPQAKKLIEVALPLDAINQASAREKSIRHGHPSTLHLWWARRPLAAARAVIFTSLVDDPDDEHANPKFVEACNDLPGDGPNVEAKGDTPRMRLFDFIERLVTWEATTDEKDHGAGARADPHRHERESATATRSIRRWRKHSVGGAAPRPGSTCQRPESGGGHDQQGDDRDSAALRRYAASESARPGGSFSPTANPSPHKEGRGFTAKLADESPLPSSWGKGPGDGGWKGASGLAADVRYYGEWMRERAFERIGHLYPKHNRAKP